MEKKIGMSEYVDAETSLCGVVRGRVCRIIGDDYLEIACGYAGFVVHRDNVKRAEESPSPPWRYHNGD